MFLSAVYLDILVGMSCLRQLRMLWYDVPHTRSAASRALARKCRMLMASQSEQSRVPLQTNINFRACSAAHIVNARHWNSGLRTTRRAQGLRGQSTDSEHAPRLYHRHPANANLPSRFVQNAIDGAKLHTATRLA